MNINSIWNLCLNFSPYQQNFLILTDLFFTTLARHIFKRTLQKFKIKQHTLYVSRTFSQFSFNCSISSFRSSISFCAMSHFCSVVSLREVLMLLVLDLDRFLPTPLPTSCCDPDWATPLDIPALGRPKVSFGSFLLRYFSNI